MDIQEGVEYVGLNKTQISGDFFGDINFRDKIKIQPTKGVVENIVSIAMDQGEIKYSLIDTVCGDSNDGSKLLGKKIIVENEYIVKIQYTTDIAGRMVFVNRFKYIEMGEIVVPKEFKGEKIEDLDRRKKIEVNSYIENLFTEVKQGEIEVNANIIVGIRIK